MDSAVLLSYLVGRVDKLELVGGQHHSRPHLSRQLVPNAAGEEVLGHRRVHRRQRIIQQRQGRLEVGGSS